MGNGKNTVLIVGATGTVGREAVAATLKQGGQVRALVRSTASAAQLPEGVEPILGDLREERAVTRALSGVTAALYVSPHEQDEVQLAQRFISACEAAQARLVFVGVHIDGKSKWRRALSRFVYGRLLSHYRPKFELSERARASATSPIILMPTNFFQNDELFREEITSGYYPTNFAHPINRVDVRDLGLAIARALLDDTLASGAYPVVGPSSLCGDDCAALWTAALSCKVRCEHDLARAIATFGQKLQSKKREDFIKTFEVLQKFAIPTNPEELEATHRLIGQAPTSYDNYVRQTAARWTDYAQQPLAADTRVQMSSR